MLIYDVDKKLTFVCSMKHHNHNFVTPGGISPASGSNLVVGASGTNQRRFDEDVNLPLIKVVVLGAPAVGKTSVVRVSSPFLFL